MARKPSQHYLIQLIKKMLKPEEHDVMKHKNTAWTKHKENTLRKEYQRSGETNNKPNHMARVLLEREGRRSQCSDDQQAAFPLSSSLKFRWASCNTCNFRGWRWVESWITKILEGPSEWCHQGDWYCKIVAGHFYQIISHSICLLSPWHWIGSCPWVPHPHENCPWHSCYPMLIHPLWTPLLCWKTHRDGPPFMPQCWAIQAAANHEVSMEGRYSRSSGMEFRWGRNSGGFEGVWGNSHSGQRNHGLERRGWLGY